MFKATPEIITHRREENMCACEQLYPTMSFGEILRKAADSLELNVIRFWEKEMK